MIESAAYALIKEEGREEGIRQGLLEGITLALELKFGAEGLRFLPSLKRIEDLTILEALHRALRDVETMEEFERLMQDLTKEK